MISFPFYVSEPDLRTMTAWCEKIAAKQWHVVQTDPLCAETSIRLGPRLRDILQGDHAILRVTKFGPDRYQSEVAGQGDTGRDDEEHKTLSEAKLGAAETFVHLFAFA